MQFGLQRHRCFSEKKSTIYHISTGSSIEKNIMCGIFEKRCFGAKLSNLCDAGDSMQNANIILLA